MTTSAAPATLDRTLAALADPQRRRVIDLLCRRPHRAGELAAELGVTPSVMSRHLRVLRESHLVDETHPPSDARVRIYTLQPAPITELHQWLQAIDAAWHDELRAFKRHVESQP